MLCAKIRSMLTTLVALAEDKIHKITTENRKATFDDVPGRATAKAVPRRAAARPGTGGAALGRARAPAGSRARAIAGRARAPAGSWARAIAGGDASAGRQLGSSDGGRARAPAGSGLERQQAGHGRRPAGDECGSRRPPRDEQQRPPRTSSDRPITAQRNKEVPPLSARPRTTSRCFAHRRKPRLVAGQQRALLRTRVRRDGLRSDEPQRLGARNAGGVDR